MKIVLKSMLATVVVILSLVVLVTSAFTPVNAVDGCVIVCPQGDVKWEEGSGYEYTDGSATIEGDENSVTVFANSGYEIIEVCIKIDGKGRRSLKYFDNGGTFGPFNYGINHVVVKTKRIQVTNTPTNTLEPTITNTTVPTNTITNTPRPTQTNTLEPTITETDIPEPTSTPEIPTNTPKPEKTKVIPQPTLEPTEICNECEECCCCCCCQTIIIIINCDGDVCEIEQ